MSPIKKREKYRESSIVRLGTAERDFDNINWKTKMTPNNIALR